MSQDERFRDKAITRQAVDYTYRLLDEDDLTQGGTAVAIKIGSHYFLATAAHTLASRHHLSVHLKRKSLTYSKFIKREFYPDNAPDVGFLEVPQEDVSRFPHCFLDVKQILPAFDRNLVLPVRVVGFPGEYLQIVEEEQIGPNGVIQTRAIHAFHQVTQTIPQSKWPTNKRNDESDVYVEFRKDVAVSLDSPGLDMPLRETADTAPQLQGMSGGGIWLEAEVANKEIWRADARLLALQSSYHKSEGWIKGTSMAKLLDLIKECYPDLEQAVADIMKGDSGA